MSMLAALLAAAALPDVTSANTMDVEFADLNGDGAMDVVMALEFAPSHVAFGDGAGGFVIDPQRVLPAKPSDSEDVAIADFDGDGDLDIVLASEDNQDNELFLNDGTGAFVDVSERLPVRGLSNAVLAFDVDVDGDVDLLFGNAGRNRLLLNDGTGRFLDATDARLPPTVDVTQDVEAGDVDGDGDVDLAVGNEDDNRLLLNDGTGVFVDASATHLPARPATEETREVDLGDVDGDGDLDMIFANVGFRAPGEGQDRLLLNDGTGRFAAAPDGALPDNPTNTLDIDLVDVDGDGDLDALYGGGFGGRVGVLLNDGSGTFARDVARDDRFVGANPVDLEIIPGTTTVYVANFQASDQLVDLK